MYITDTLWNTHSGFHVPDSSLFHLQQKKKKWLPNGDCTVFFEDTISVHSHLRIQVQVTSQT